MYFVPREDHTKKCKCNIVYASLQIGCEPVSGRGGGFAKECWFWHRTTVIASPDRATNSWKGGMTGFKKFRLPARKIQTVQPNHIELYKIAIVDGMWSQSYRNEHRMFFHMHKIFLVHHKKGTSKHVSCHSMNHIIACLFDLLVSKQISL